MTDIATASDPRPELVQTTVDDYYNSLAYEVYNPATEREYSLFYYVDGRLRLKAYPHNELIHSDTGKLKLLSTIAGLCIGGSAIRHGLGFVVRKRDSSCPQRLLQLSKQPTLRWMDKRSQGIQRRTAR